MDKKIAKTGWPCRVKQEVRQREIGRRDKKVCKDQFIRSGETGRRIKQFAKDQVIAQGKAGTKEQRDKQADKTFARTS